MTLPRGLTEALGHGIGHARYMQPVKRVFAMWDATRGTQLSETVRWRSSSSYRILDFNCDSGTISFAGASTTRRPFLTCEYYFLPPMSRVTSTPTTTHVSTWHLRTPHDSESSESELRYRRASQVGGRTDKSTHVLFHDVKLPYTTTGLRGLVVSSCILLWYISLRLGWTRRRERRGTKSKEKGTRSKTRRAASSMFVVEDYDGNVNHSRNEIGARRWRRSTAKNRDAKTWGAQAWTWMALEAQIGWAADVLAGAPALPALARVHLCRCPPRRASSRPHPTW